MRIVGMIILAFGSIIVSNTTEKGKEFIAILGACLIATGATLLWLKRLKMNKLDGLLFFVLGQITAIIIKKLGAENE